MIGELFFLGGQMDGKRVLVREWRDFVVVTKKYLRSLGEKDCGRSLRGFSQKREKESWKPTYSLLERSIPGMPICDLISHFHVD